MPVPHEIVEAAYKGNLNELQAWLDGGGTAFLEEEVDYTEFTGEEPLSDESDEPSTDEDEEPVPNGDDGGTGEPSGADFEDGFDLGDDTGAGIFPRSFSGIEYD